MTTVVVEQPDDLPVVGVSEHNPYKNEQGRLHTDEPRPVYFGTTVYHIPATSIYMASELEQFARTIKFITFFDTVLAFINFLVVGYYPVLIAVAFNNCGYFGALRFNKKLLGAYCAFQFFNFVSKIAYISTNPGAQIAAIIGLTSIFNMVMVVMVMRFIRMIPT